MKFRVRLAAAAGIVAVLGAIWLHRQGAIAVIEEGAVYGAPQLGADRLREVVHRLGIRTVVNLRGHGRGGTWYRDETAVCSELGLTHVTISFPVDSWPARFRLIELLETVDGADGPILMHCLRGVDRTGWASAVLDLAAGRSVDQARQRLAWWRGHLCSRPRCPYHRFIEMYLQSLVQRNARHSGSAFRSWVRHEYSPPAYDAELELVSELPVQVAARQRVSLRVRVSNRGSEPWCMSPNDTEGVRLGVRLLGPIDPVPENPVSLFRSRETRARDVARAGLEHGEIAAGEQRVFELTWTAPASEGQYLVQVDMVNEGVAWFCDVGWPGLIRVLHVGEEAVRRAQTSGIEYDSTCSAGSG